jgi:hypothetical protein
LLPFLTLAIVYGPAAAVECKPEAAR